MSLPFAGERHIYYIKTTRMNKILVISLHKLGDNIQVSPIFRTLKKKYPGSKISVLTEKAFKFPFEQNPFIDEICFFDRNKYSGKEIKTLTQAQDEKEGELIRLAGKKFDLIINRQSSFEGAAIASVIGATEIRGLYMNAENIACYDDVWTRLLFAACQKRYVNPFNFVDYGINIAGEGDGERHLDIFQSAEKDHCLPSEFIANPGLRIIAFQPGSNSPMRRWSTTSFAKTADLLFKTDEKYRVIIIGSKGESVLAKEILSQIQPSQHNKIADMTCNTPLTELPALLKHCSALVTNDTGPMHVAAAVGCPVIALYFGESFVNETGPYGPGNLVIHAKLPCLPCTYITKCERQFACREMVKPEHVLELARYSIGGVDKISPALFSGTEVHFSGRGKLESEIRFRPLLKPVAMPEDILRVVFRVVFKKYLTGIDSDLTLLGKEIASDYESVEKCVNSMVDIDVGIINLFSRNSMETSRLMELTKETFINLRSLLA